MFFDFQQAEFLLINRCWASWHRERKEEFIDILTAPSNLRWFLTLHRMMLPKVVSLGLCVRLESWRYPIPTFSIFLAAFPSRSWFAPQLRQTTWRTQRSNLPHLYPQSEQIWVVGSQRSITLNSRPNFSDLASQKARNWYQPCKLIALDNFRFWIMDDTFKSSKTITWFSLTILVDNLCRKSLRVSASRLCSLAIWMRVLWRRFESWCWRASLRCSFLTRQSSFE